MSENLDKPIPAMTHLTQPFWNAAKQGRFVLQRCGKCGTYNFFPKPWCIECGSRDLSWTDAKPSGTVYSFTVSRIVAMNYPGWEKELPVVMGLLDLDDGPRMYAQVIGCAPEDVSIGMRVTVCLEPLGNELAIPKFRPEAT
jgi:uncharacterized protein